MEEDACELATALVLQNGGYHPSIGHADTRLLNRMRSSAVSAVYAVYDLSVSSGPSARLAKLPYGNPPENKTSNGPDDLKNEGCKETIRTVSTSIGGRAAANEVLREGLADDVLGEHTIVRQTRMIEEALSRVGAGGAVAYGALEILDAAEQGAIETLIIIADLLRDENQLCVDRTWAAISELVLSSGGEVEQSSKDHDAGAQLLGFGGVIALLRWKLE